MNTEEMIEELRKSLSKKNEDILPKIREILLDRVDVIYKDMFPRKNETSKENMRILIKILTGTEKHKASVYDTWFVNVNGKGVFYRYLQRAVELRLVRGKFLKECLARVLDSSRQAKYSPSKEMEERIEKIKELIRKGYSGTAIQKILNLSRHQVHRVLKKLKATDKLPKENAIRYLGKDRKTIVTYGRSIHMEEKIKKAEDILDQVMDLTPTEASKLLNIPKQTILWAICLLRRRPDYFPRHDPRDYDYKRKKGTIDTKFLNGVIVKGKTIEEVKKDLKMDKKMLSKRLSTIVNSVYELNEAYSLMELLEKTECVNTLNSFLETCLYTVAVDSNILSPEILTESSNLREKKTTITHMLLSNNTLEDIAISVSLSKNVLLSLIENISKSIEYYLPVNPEFHRNLNQNIEILIKSIMVETISLEFFFITEEVFNILKSHYSHNLDYPVFLFYIAYLRHKDKRFEEIVSIGYYPSLDLDTMVEEEFKDTVTSYEHKKQVRQKRAYLTVVKYLRPLVTFKELLESMNESGEYTFSPNYISYYYSIVRKKYVEKINVGLKPLAKIYKS